jgi:plasmid stabilization system protein ParE
VTPYRLVAEPAADRDVEAAFAWYQNEREGLGLEFLDELRVAYGRIADGPLKYRELRSGIRRTLLRRFPYAVYFSVEGEVVVILAVLHAHRDPAEWQTRRG